MLQCHLGNVLTILIIIIEKSVLPITLNKGIIEDQLMSPAMLAESLNIMPEIAVHEIECYYLITEVNVKLDLFFLLIIQDH